MVALGLYFTYFKGPGGLHDNLSKRPRQYQEEILAATEDLQIGSFRLAGCPPSRSTGALEILQDACSVLCLLRASMRGRANHQKRVSAVGRVLHDMATVWGTFSISGHVCHVFYLLCAFWRFCSVTLVNLLRAVPDCA